MKRTRRTNKIIMISSPSYEGEPIEKKIRRIVENKEPISDGAQIVYTEKKDGVLPQYDIRTDKWAIALDAMDKVQGARIAKSKEYLKKPEEKPEEKVREEPAKQGVDPSSN